MSSETKSQHPGFTLIELLVVIVVIAILAAIAVVSYRGIQGRAAGTVLQSDVRSSGNQLEIGMATDGEYPSSESELPKSPGTEYEYDSDGDSYCLTATSSKSPKAYYISNDSGGVKEGTCPGHSGPSQGGGGGGSGTIANNDPIQNMTPAHCSAMTVYDGSNNDALITLTDSRGGTTRNYTVGKLADNKCWMLDNLKLGSTSSSITLTPSDSDVASNFTLPQVKTTGSTAHSGAGNGYDTPYVYGPVTGDNGSGATNYGYLYNWPAATAGESRTTHDQNAGNAPHSICPKNWRLPTGGGGANTDFGDLDIAFGGTGLYAYSGANIARWNHSGPLRGVLAGLWWGGFDDQGDFGYLWSSSASPNNADSAFGAGFNPSSVYPGDGGSDRSSGFGVRCLLN